MLFQTDVLRVLTIRFHCHRVRVKDIEFETFFLNHSVQRRVDEENHHCLPKKIIDMIDFKWRSTKIQVLRFEEEQFAPIDNQVDQMTLVDIYHTINSSGRETLQKIYHIPLQSVQTENKWIYKLNTFPNERN